MDTEGKAFMTGEPIWIEAEAPSLAALDLMIDHAIRHLPVVDVSGIVRGVLSFDDLRAAWPVPLRLGTPLGVTERQLASDIAHALERAEWGSLEVCERCGHRIPQRRPRALPGTTLCIRCSEQAEQR